MLVIHADTSAVIHNIPITKYRFFYLNLFFSKNDNTQIQGESRPGQRCSCNVELQQDERLFKMHVKRWQSCFDYRGKP